MKKIFVLISFILLIISCIRDSENEANKTEPVILVSKDSSGVFYAWLKEAAKDSGFVCINMYTINSNDSINTLLSLADGIIISGGADIHPELYGQEDEIVRCGEIDTYRDSLEQLMIKYAVKNRIPLLGVCRGHQLLNVTMGGTLIVDIPEDLGSDTLHRNNGRVEHGIYIDKDSYLYNMVKVDSGIVISNHHQAIAEIALGFYVSSYAEDDVFESIELVDTVKHPFILGVQWHPEGMDVSNPLSGKIAIKYLNKVKQHYFNN